MELATWMRTRTCRSRWPRAPRAAHRPPPPAPVPRLTGQSKQCNCLCSLWAQPHSLTRTASFSRAGVALWMGCHGLCFSYMCIFIYMSGVLGPLWFYKHKTTPGPDLDPPTQDLAG